MHDEMTTTQASPVDSRIACKSPELEDLRVFMAVVRKSSFVLAADMIGMSPAYVSKRIRILEQALAVKLLHEAGPKPRQSEQVADAEVDAAFVFAGLQRGRCEITGRGCQREARGGAIAHAAQRAVQRGALRAANKTESKSASK